MFKIPADISSKSVIWERLSI